MPKVKIACLILATVLASVGTFIFLTNLNGGAIPPLDVPTDDINTYLDKPVEGTPADVTDVRENLFIAHKVLQEKPGFYGISEGATTSFGISQQVLNTRYVVGEFGNKNSFKEMVTKGVVPNAYQLYMWGDNYLHRACDKVNALDDVKWKNSASKLAKDDFYDSFGHRSDKLTGYILNYDTVKSGKLEKVENGIYTFRFVLDVNESTLLIKKEMVTNGNLNGYPTFAKAEIVVAMDADWNVKTLTTDCKYTAKTMGISATCSEDITETFYDYEGDLPEKDFYEQFFDADYSGVDKEKGALDVLLDMFSPYLNGEDLQVALAVTNGNTEYVNGLVSVSGLDISDLSKLSVDVKIANALDVGYEHGAGKIYLKYQDFQASTTVDGVMGLVATLAPLFGDGSNAGSDLLGELDVDALLAALTYEISDDGTVCTVSLPLSLGDVTIDAKLYGAVDGENYTFTNAVIKLGDVTVTLAPKAWTVAQKVGAYPEILGLAELIQNGKIALDAQLNLTIGDVNYDVTADALVDLATLNVALNAELGNNGSISAVLADKVVYVQYGEVKVKLDLANIGELVAAVEKLVGTGISVDMPEISIVDVLGMLSAITATDTGDGVVMNLSVGEVACNVYLVASDNGWNLDKITVEVGGISAIIAPSTAFGEVTVPQDADAYADVTELVETFADPILNLINGNSFGVSFALNLSVAEKDYYVTGSVAIDAHKTVSVLAKVYDGSGCIVDAHVIYGNGTVYLTLNGINAAFAVNGGAVDFNIEDILQLLDNEQIAQLLETHEELGALIDKIVEIAGVASNFALSDLLDVDFTEVITAFEFVNGKLSLTVDGSVLGLDGIAVDLAVSTDGNGLTVELGGLQLASIRLELTATVTPDVEIIDLPDASDYVLNISGSVEIGDVIVDVEISADLINMDVWAVAHIYNETVYLRYTGGVVYVSYGNVAIKLDTANLGDVVASVVNLLGIDASSLDGVDLDINTVLSAVSIDLTGASLVLTVSLGDVKLTVAPNEQQADKLDISGYFVDGNALISSILQTVEAYKDADSVAVVLNVTVTVDGNVYTANVKLYYNKGLHAIVTLTDKDGALVNADVYYVDGVLYLDVNGIHQAIELNLQQTNGLDADALQQLIGQVKAIIAELDNATLNAIVETVESIPEKLANAKYSEFISLFRFENGTLTVGLDLSQLDLGAFTATVGLGETLTLTIDEMSFGSAKVAVDASVANGCEKVVAPALDGYYNEFKVTVGDFEIYLKLDLYNATVVGETTFMGGTVAFKYVGGSIYATYGNVGVTLNIAEIDSLMEVISQFVTLPELSLGEIDVMATVKTLLDSLQFTNDVENGGYSVSASVLGVDVTISFTRANGMANLKGVTVAVDGINVQVDSISNYGFVDVDTNGYFVNVYQLVSTFADNVSQLINSQNYAFGINGTVKLGANTYAINANVTLSGTDVYVTFKLSVGNAVMLKGELWVLNNMLYVSVGDLKLVVELEDSGDDTPMTVDKLKDTLNNLVGYNGYLDQVIELVCDLLDTDLNSLKPAEMVTKLMLANGTLTLGLNGTQFNLSQIGLSVSAATNGLQFALTNVVYKDVNIVEISGSVSTKIDKIPTPIGDFSTNLTVTIDDNNTLYVNIDLLHDIIKLQLESRYGENKSIKLDIEYSITNKILKITNGKNLYVSADILNIAEIIQEIDDIVNEFAGTESGALSGLSGLGNLDLQAIVKTIKIAAYDSSAVLTLTALGFDVTASFADGNIVSIVVPVMDGLTLTVKPSATKADYTEFPVDAKYVRIDEVFNDYFYGAGDVERGAIDALIHTNSWRFDFTENSEITITKDDGTVDKYRIAAGSSLTFYYNKADSDNISLRAKLYVDKWNADVWKEFILLDAAYIDGRIYVTYDSNSSNNNVLKASVSLNAIKECINLLPALYNVVPQLEDVVNNVKSRLENSNGISIGELASIFNQVTYTDDKVFTLSLNAGIIEGLGAISLSVQQQGEGLQLNTLTAQYNNVSISINGIVVTASPSVENGDGSRNFDYVDDYILSYLSDNGNKDAHMDLDSIRELLAGFVITADNTDANGNRSFSLQGNVYATLLGTGKFSGATINMNLYVHVDIDKDNNVHLAVKIHRDSAEGLAAVFGMIYNDEGGDSYILLDSKQQTITLARNSINKRTWCKKCGWKCTNSVAHAIAFYHSKKEVYDYEYSGNMSYLVTNLALADFAADTSTLVGYILKLINLTSIIENSITSAIGKENTNEYGVEDILKSYTYTYEEAKSAGTFAVGLDLSPIDSALGAVTLNILHAGNLKDVYYDDDNNLHSGDATLTEINGTASMIKVMDATFGFTLVTPTAGLARNYVVNGNYLW